MNKGFQNATKRAVVCLLLVMLTGSAVFAQRTRRDNGNREAGTSEKDKQKEKMRQEATKSFGEVTDALTNILEKASRNQRPEETAIEKARQLLDENKRNGWAFDEAQRGEYMLLQAWVGYYEDNLEEAVRWSMKAAKTDPANGDAWISQGVFCMLNGKRPMVPRIKKSKSDREGTSRRPRKNDSDSFSPFETNTASTKPYGEEGVLEFDMSLLRSEMLKKRFTRFEYQSVDGAEIEYVPGEDTACMLFWQSEEVRVADSNGVSDSDEPSFDVAMMYGGGSSRQQVDYDIEGQREYMELVSEAFGENEPIIILQINTNKQERDSESGGDAEVKEAAPLVIAAEPTSGAEEYAGLRADKPFAVIVDKEGIVRYSGQAAGFMPAFVLTDLTGVPIDLEKEEEMVTSETGNGKKSSRKSKQDVPFHFLMSGYEIPVPEEEEPAPGHDPNKPVEAPVAEPNAPAEEKPLPKPASKARDPQDFPTQSLENQIRAEKLLQSAQMHIEESRKLPMKNPKQGIEDARKVIQQFPNTVHAEKARDLLRRVPNKWKTQHNITDEELKNE
jgi:tetratricopeptide (TPR) repeat protein